jgi:hypothetical protein
MNTDPKDVFRFDRERAAVDLNGPEDALWPVNAYSNDPDELNQLLEAGQNAGLITARRQARLYVYPLSLSEPDPLLVVSPGDGPALLGHELKLSDEAGEDPIAFTLRLLEEVVDRGNAMLVKALADGEALDRITAYMNRPGQWNGGDVCEVVANELQRSGRVLLDNADE